MKSKVLSLLTSFVMLVLVATALLKLSDLREFDHALSTWSLLPEMVRKLLVVLIPSAELAIGLVYLTNIHRRGAAIAAAIFLIGAAGVYAAHLLAGQRPNCGCAGVLQEYAWARTEGWSLLARNGGLAMCCLPAILRRRGAPKASTPACVAPRPNAFTLIEILVVIAVTAVIVAIALPSMARIRESGKRTKTTSYLRSHAANVSVYSAQYKDLFPYYANPTGVFEWNNPQCPHPVQLTYFFAAYYWHASMPDLYQGTTIQTLSPPGSRPQFCSSWFMFSSSLRARPEFWNETTRTGPEQWLPVRTDEVLYPAAKVMFKNGAVTEDQQAEGIDFIAACDGHAAVIKSKDLRSGYFNGEGSWTGSWFIRDEPGMHTIDGARGRDIATSR